MSDQSSGKPPRSGPNSLTEATLALLRELAQSESAPPAAPQASVPQASIARASASASEQKAQATPASSPPPASAARAPEPAAMRPAPPPIRPQPTPVPPATPTPRAVEPPVPAATPSPRAAEPHVRPVEAVQVPVLQARPAAPLVRESTRPPIEPPPVVPPTLGPPPISDSMRGAAIAGWSIIILFFGVLGAWAVTAPLNGAVVANGLIKVEGNRRAVQHLDGGIVKELRVKDGSRVNAGDVLIVLDETQAQAEHEVLSRQALILRATEARLTAELINGTPIMPDTLKSMANDPQVGEIWNAQLRQFESRRTALEGQRNVIREKIAQLEHQITGAQGQVKSYQTQRTSLVEEMQSLEPLLKQGLIARPRYLQLERSAFALDGQIADAIASIARSRQAIAEQQQQIAQLDNDRMTEVTRDLRETQAKLLEVLPRMVNAQAVLSRMDIRAPNTGRVVGLTVFTVGAVVGKGEKVMEVVPDQDSLVVEAQVAVESISDVHPNARAEVHLTAYQQRIVPVVRGEVMQISADRLTDNRTGQSYYTVLVRIDESELAALPNVQLYPGMPATVMIPTVERTAFMYLVGPLVMSFNHAFRQR